MPGGADAQARWVAGALERMPVRILHRYIFGELLKALGLGLAAVTGVVCLGMVLEKLQKEGLGPLTSLGYMGLSIPGAAYIALGLSAVLATTLVYGRLAAENEVMACRASGIPISSLIWPAVLLAVVAASANLLLATWPLPASSYAAKQLALNNVERWFFAQMAAKGRVKVKDAGFEITVDRVVGDMLYGPTLKYRGSQGQTYCSAPYGRVTFDRRNNRVRMSLAEAQVLDESHTTPVRGTHTVSLILPTTVPREVDDLSLWDLMVAQRAPGRYAKVLKDLRDVDDPDASEESVRRAKSKVRAEAMAEMHGRMAAALGCFALVLLGAGFGVLFHSGHLLTAFGVAIAPWLGATLLTMAAVEAVSTRIEEPQDALYLIWLPNFLMLLLAAGVLAHLVWGWTSPVRLREVLQGRRT